MTKELDALRVALRRRALAEDWTTIRALVAEDLAETARDDGTHALRSVEASAERLGIGTATVKRHRAKLVEDGAFVLRKKGGRGRGANTYDLAESRSPDVRANA